MRALVSLSDSVKSLGTVAEVSVSKQESSVEQDVGMKRRKHLSEMTSSPRKRERTGEMLQILAEKGYSPEDVLASVKYVQARVAVDKEEDVVEDDEQEGEEHIEAREEEEIDFQKVLAYSDEELVEYCLRNERVQADMERITKRNADPWSVDQQEVALPVYDKCLADFHEVCGISNWSNADPRRSAVRGWAAKATVGLLKATREFKGVTYKDIQRWVTNRKERVKKEDKQKPGPKVYDGFELSVLDKLLIVVIEVRKISELIIYHHLPLNRSCYLFYCTDRCYDLRGYYWTSTDTTTTVGKEEAAKSAAAEGSEECTQAPRGPRAGDR